MLIFIILLLVDVVASTKDFGSTSSDSTITENLGNEELDTIDWWVNIRSGLFEPVDNHEQSPIQICKTKLAEMKAIELDSPRFIQRFENLSRSPLKGERLEPVENHLFRLRTLIENSVILPRKLQTFTDILLNILKDGNFSCIARDLKKLHYVVISVEAETLLGSALRSRISGIVNDCWAKYSKLLHSRLLLQSAEDQAVIEKLINFVGPHIRTFVNLEPGQPQAPDPGSLEIIAEASVKYLQSSNLDVSGISNIEGVDSTSLIFKIKEAYNLTLHEPCSRVCNSAHRPNQRFLEYLTSVYDLKGFATENAHISQLVAKTNLCCMIDSHQSSLMDHITSKVMEMNGKSSGHGWEEFMSDPQDSFNSIFSDDNESHFMDLN